MMQKCARAHRLYRGDLQLYMFTRNCYHVMNLTYCSTTCWHLGDVMVTWPVWFFSFRWSVTRYLSPLTSCINWILFTLISVNNEQDACVSGNNVKPEPVACNMNALNACRHLLVASDYFYGFDAITEFRNRLLLKLVPRTFADFRNIR